MRNHPVTPMTDASLVRLMEAQSEGKAAVIPVTVIERGAEAIREALAQLREQGIRYAVTDTLTAEHLTAIGEVLGALDDKIAANTALTSTAAFAAKLEYRSALSDGALEFTVAEASTAIARGITPRYVPDGEGTRVLNQKCVRDQLVSLEPSRWTDDSKVKREKLVAVDDVLVNSTGQGTLGRVARWTVQEVATVDSHITIVRPDPNVSDTAVIGQAILAIEAEIEARGEGSTGQTELSGVELGRARIQVPSRERAERLGTTLRALTASQDSARAENLVLAAMRDALLPQLMSGKLRIREAEQAVSEVV